MKLITARKMREAEAQYFTRVPSFEVMDRAALAVANCVQRTVPEGTVVILCGPGNNGGDGYGCAAHLLRAGRGCRVYALGPARGDALVEREAYEALGGKVLPLDALDLTGACAVVDALLGIGFSRPPEGVMEEAIARVNESAVPVFAVDIPTGVDADTGAVPGACIRADHTVTFAFAKPGHFLYPGRSMVGELHVAPLGLEADVGETFWYTLTQEESRRLLPDRPLQSHKGTFGTVLCVMGSLGMTGAGSLASEATLRAGCGKTTWLYPGHCPVQGAREVMAMPLGEYRFAPSDVETVLDYACGADVLALGPGVGRTHETFQFVRRLLRRSDLPFVLDADGIMAFAGQADRIRPGGILTPHPGEAAALLGVSVKDILLDPIQAVRTMANLTGCIAVLKGASTLISDGENVCINTTGNPGMATAGSGDVLTGLAAGFLAQGMSAFDASCLAVYVHGLAGDLAARDGERGMTAGDILACVRMALHILDSAAADGRN